MKLSEVLLVLQKPGNGPTSLPPLQIALEVGHEVHFPGDFIYIKEKLEPFGQLMHLPSVLKSSPTSHSLN